MVQWPVTKKHAKGASKVQSPAKADERSLKLSSTSAPYRARGDLAPPYLLDDEQEQVVKWMQEEFKVSQRFSGDQVKTALVLMGLDPASTTQVTQALFKDRESVGKAEVVTLLSELQQRNPAGRLALFQKTFVALDPYKQGAVFTSTLADALLTLELATVAEVAEMHAYWQQLGLTKVSLSQFIILPLPPGLEQIFSDDCLEALATFRPSSAEENEAEIVRDLPRIERFMLWLLHKVSFGFQRDETPVDLSRWTLQDPREVAILSQEPSVVLSVMERIKIRGVIVMATAAVGGAGVIAAFLCSMLNDQAADEVGSDDSLAFYVLSISYSLAWSVVELSMIFATCIVAAVALILLSRMAIWPLDHDRAVLIGALGRAATELGFPQGRRMGVTPQKKAAAGLLFLASLAYLAKRAVFKFLVKLLLRKLGPRFAVKFTPSLELGVEIGINVLFNSVVVWRSLVGTAFCCVGHSGSRYAVVQLMEYRHKQVLMSDGMVQPFSDTAKITAMRAVGVAVTNRRVGEMHPTPRHILALLVKLWATKPFLQRMSDAPKSDPSGSPTAWSLRAATRRVVRRFSSTSLSSRFSKDSFMGNCVATWCGDESLGELTREEALDIQLLPLGLDDDECFRRALRGLRPEDADFVLAVFVISTLADNSMSARDWRYLCKLLKMLSPSRVPSCAAAVRVRRALHFGYEKRPEDFHQLLHGHPQECVPPWVPEFWMLGWARVLWAVSSFRRWCQRRREALRSLAAEKSESLA